MKLVAPVQCVGCRRVNLEASSSGAICHWCASTLFLRVLVPWRGVLCCPWCCFRKRAPTSGSISTLKLWLQNGSQKRRQPSLRGRRELVGKLVSPTMATRSASSSVLGSSSMLVGMTDAGSSNPRDSRNCSTSGQSSALPPRAPQRRLSQTGRLTMSCFL